MQYRSSFVAAVYHKSLKLSSTHHHHQTDSSSSSYGDVMNLASNDAERFLLASLFGNYLIWSPLQSLAILATGWVCLGPAFVAGFGLLLTVVAPLQTWLSRRFIHYRSRIATLTDARVNLVSQTVRAVRVVKTSGLELRFGARIQTLRK